MVKKNIENIEYVTNNPADTLNQLLCELLCFED